MNFEPGEKVRLDVKGTVVEMTNWERKKYGEHVKIENEDGAYYVMPSDLQLF